MSKILINVNRQPVIITTTGDKPTVPTPASAIPTDSVWTATDIMKGEIAWNSFDDIFYYRDNSDNIIKLSKIESIVAACSDETTALTTGTAKVTFRMPYAFTLTAVRASVTTAPTGATITVDINEGGSTILSTKITIDAGETTSTTAAIPAVISDDSLADDAEITIDIDQVGSGTAGAGLKVALIGYQS